MENVTYSGRSRTATIVLRTILGVVFIFSGFMKTIDPWGTAVMITEYFRVFNMEWLSGLSVVLAVALCAGELVLGLMLVFNVRLRLASILTLIAMIGFTILTFIVAVFDPLDTCGCFGDAVKIDNWHSFFKNLILLPMSIALWWILIKGKVFNFSKREIILVSVFVVLSTGLAVYSLRHLPVVDLYDYKVGTNLRTEVYCTRCADRDVKVVYADRITGRQQAFELSDTTWYDDTRWEFVRTAHPYDEGLPEISEYDFALWHDGLNFADEVIFAEGKTHLIVIRDPQSKITGRCNDKLVNHVDDLLSKNKRIIVVSAIDINEVDELPLTVDIGTHSFELYGMESALLKLLLRADVGEVVIDNGIIASKRSCHDLK